MSRKIFEIKKLESGPLQVFLKESLNAMLYPKLVRILSKCKRVDFHSL